MSDSRSIKTEATALAPPRTPAVLVSSCDHYYDAWAPFFYFFHRYWPDCPYPIYLISNFGCFASPEIISLQVGRERSWADNLAWALDRIPHETILYFQEDYFLNQPVDSPRLNEVLHYFHSSQADYLGLYPMPSPADVHKGNPLNIGLVEPEAPMRASLQSAIWRKSSLRGLLKSGESAWDMERWGTERSRGHLFLRIRSLDAAPIRYYVTAIKRGCWEWGAVKLCLRHGIRLDFSIRPLRSRDPQRAKRQKWFRRWTALKHRLMPRQFKVEPQS